jgi:hypothetical protein
MIIIDIPAGKPINWELMSEQARAALGTDLICTNNYEFGAVVRFLLEDGSSVDEADCQALVDAHDGSQLSTAEAIEQDREASDAAATAAALSPSLKAWLVKDQATFVADATALSDAQFKAMVAMAIWMIIRGAFGLLIAKIQNGVE